MPEAEVAYEYIIFAYENAQIQLNLSRCEKGSL